MAMFLTAIADGVGMFFSHWEIWVGCFVYGSIFILYYFMLRFVLRAGGENRGVQMAGCVTNLFGGLALQGIAVSFFVTAILPILYGGDGYISHTFLIDNWWMISKTGLMSICAVIIFSLVPILNIFSSQAPGSITFVQGVLVFHVLTRNVTSEMMQERSPSAIVFPGFWTFIGFLILSTVIVYAVSIAIIDIMERLRLIDDESFETMGFEIGNFVGVFPGLLCICIYCSYVGQ